MSQSSRFIVIIRPEFMEFCNDACRAASFNHLLFRIAGKCKDKPKEEIQAGEILWYGTTELIREEMANAWGECKIRQEVNGLVDIGIIGRTKDPNWGVNRTKHFFFGQEQCAKFLELCEKHHICFVHLDLPDEVKHLIYSSNANDKSIKCICANDKSIECKQSNHQMQAIDTSDASDKSIGAITKKTTKNNTKEDNEERESPPNTLDTHTIVSDDTAHTLPSKTEEFLEKLREWHIEDEQVAHSQDEEMFIPPEHTHENIEHPFTCYYDGQYYAACPLDEPQGDTHATAASGHPHRVGEPAARGGVSGHTPVDDGQVATSEARPILETQEIDKGDTHATRVPTVPRADHPTPGERDAAGHPQSAGHRAVGATDDLPVVHPVGRGTPDPEDRAGRAQDGSVAKKDAAKTLTETPPTSMPAQSLSLPQAEQAALGAPKPLAEPDMSGKWSHEKCVEYAEWCNQRRYTEKMHEEQIKAAHAIHKNDVGLTLEQFKQSYDERNDPWWKEHKGKLHVNDMKARGASGIDRVHEMLQRIEDAASKSRAQPRLQVVARQSAVKRYSSYDDPNFSSENDFYPVEGGSYAAASV